MLIILAYTLMVTFTAYDFVMLEPILKYLFKEPVLSIGDIAF